MHFTLYSSRHFFTHICLWLCSSELHVEMTRHLYTRATENASKVLRVQPLNRCFSDRVDLSRCFHRRIGSSWQSLKIMLQRHTFETATAPTSFRVIWTLQTPYIFNSAILCIEFDKKVCDKFRFVFQGFPAKQFRLLAKMRVGNFSCVEKVKRKWL